MLESLHFSHKDNLAHSLSISSLTRECKRNKLSIWELKSAPSFLKTRVTNHSSSPQFFRFFWHLQSQVPRNTQVSGQTRMVGCSNLGAFLRKICDTLWMNNWTDFFFHTYSMWRFLSQESNLYHSSSSSCCSDNIGSITHCTTRELPVYSIILIYSVNYWEDISQFWLWFCPFIIALPTVFALCILKVCYYVHKL